MEFCGGGSVEALYKCIYFVDCFIWLALKSPLYEKEIAIIMKESFKGLEFLHSVQKMHRDIKSGNILLTEKGGIKLGLFVSG